MYMYVHQLSAEGHISDLTSLSSVVPPSPFLPLPCALHPLPLSLPLCVSLTLALHVARRHVIFDYHNVCGWS